MKNKDLQEQRMRGYFIQATKDLLKAEGLKSISVRNVAARAGYAYTTMYGYFKDVNELVFLCVKDFFEECVDHVRTQTAGQEPGVARLKTAVRAYADFFVQYPGVFELFFLEKMENFREKKQVTELIGTSLDRVCAEDWNYCVAHGLVKTEQMELISSHMRHMVYGILLLYLNRRTPATYPAFVQQLVAQLDSLLDTPAASGRKGKYKEPTVRNSLITINVGNNR